ncbi:MAG: hypothetical protein Q7R97_03720 [Candidatus Daviesbacteria bacterium]|nr:hypothetical protein [Candidatus Daviesbacteria bacterium]
MSNNNAEKTKENKLRELMFLFESESKPFVKFRADKLYKAMFEAVDRMEYKDFMAFDIVKDIKEHHPDLVEAVREEPNASFEKRVGSRINMLARKFIFKQKEENKTIRQFKWEINPEIDEEVIAYIKKYLEIE